MNYPGDFGGSLSNNPLSHFTPSSSTPAAIGVQAIPSPFHTNVSEPFRGATTMPWSGHHPDANALIPPAVAPQTTFQPESHPYCWTMPQQAGGVPNANPLQHFSGVAAQPVHGVAATNILVSQPCRHNHYTTHGHGWPQPSPPPPQQQQQQQQAPPASGYPTLQPPPAPQDAHFHQRAPPAGANSYGATSWAPPMPHAGFPASWASPAQESGGQASWAPPSQQPGGQTICAPPAQQPPAGGQKIWAPPEQLSGVRVPAASPANGSGQSQSQSQPPALGKTFEEFLMDAGVLNEWAGDDLVLQGLMQDLQAALGQVVPDAPMAAAASLGGVGPPPPPPRPGAGAVGPFSGPSRYQVGLYMAQAQEEEDEEEPVGSAGRDPADARARRIRRMGKRREARARHGY